MDPATLAQLEVVQQLILLITAFTNSRLMPFQVLLQRPDGICDVLIHHRDIPLLNSNCADVSIFQHHGIVSALFGHRPEPHFLVMGYLEAIHNALETFYLVQVHAMLTQVVNRFIRFAASTPGPCPAAYHDARRRPYLPMRPVRPVLAHHPSSIPMPTSIVQPLPGPSHPAVPPRLSTMETFQATVIKIEELLQRQRSRQTARTPTPVRPTLPPTVEPTSPVSVASSRPHTLHCANCEQAQAPLTTDHPRLTALESLERSRRPALETLRAQSDEFATALYQSAPEPPTRRRRVVSTARQASPTVSPPPASSDS
jgi:hypothetical protein